MKNLSEKFDQLPQDFDREAIWAGIERPKKDNKPKYIFGMVFLFAIIGSCFFFENNTESGITDFEKISVENENVSVEENKIESGGGPLNNNGENTKIINAGIADNLLSSKAYKEEGVQRIVEKSFTLSEVGQDGSSGFYAELIENGSVVKQNANEFIPTVDDGVNRDGNSYLPPNYLPLLSLYVHEEKAESRENEKSIGVKNLIDPKKKMAKNRVAFLMGLGQHQSDYSSLNESINSLRNSLEKEQWDISIGLSYERVLKKDFFLSFSFNYNLYKDKINTTYVDDASDNPVEIDYELYNHYHVFSGNVGFGKRFVFRQFFFDLSGGGGMAITPFNELDYFVEEGTLASVQDIENNYRKVLPAYFSGKAAIGRRVSSRHFIRAGVEWKSNLQLTKNTATVNHNIRPVHFFLESGIHF